MADRHDAVFMNAGSYDMTPKSSSLTLMFLKAVARTVPSSIGTSYDLPVRLSVIVSESETVAVPPPVSVCSSVPIALLYRGGKVKSLPTHCGGDAVRRPLRRCNRGEHGACDEQRADEHERGGNPARG